MFQFSLTADTTNSSPLDIAAMFDSVSGALMWIFFIVLAIVVAIIYVKKKNADSDGNKHS